MNELYDEKEKITELLVQYFLYKRELAKEPGPYGTIEYFDTNVVQRNFKDHVKNMVKFGREHHHFLLIQLGSCAVSHTEPFGDGHVPWSVRIKQNTQDMIEAQARQYLLTLVNRPTENSDLAPHVADYYGRE